MDNTPKVPGAFSIIAEQLPKWWKEPSSEGLKGTVETMIPQDAVDLGLMVAGGPGGKLARKAGVALMGAGASTDAEAGNIIPAVLTGMKKFLPELMVDLRKGASRSELMQKYGVFPLTHNAVDVVEHLPTPGSARVLDKTLLARMSDPTFSNPQARAISLGELLNHPELYAKVPDLKGLTVAQLRGLRTAAAGEYSLKSPGSLLPKSGRHEPGADTGLEMIVTGANPFERHPITPHFADVTPLSGLERGDYSLLDHEVNHALQARARGSVTDGPWETRLHEVNASLGAQDIPTDTLIQQLDEVFPLGDFQGFNAQKFEAPNIGNSSQQALALQNLRGLPNLRQRMRDFTGYAEGGPVKPKGMEHTRSSGQDATTQPLTGSALKALVRGWMAGTAGLPGDLEGLARTVDKYTTLNPAIRQLKDTTPVLPTADFYKEWLPGKQQGDEVISDIGSLFGGVGATKPVALGKGALSRIAAATPAPRAGSMAAQRGVIKAPGGNWLSGSVEDALKGLKQPTGEFLAYEVDPTPLNAFVDKQLRNYIRNDMATERDPIRALAESWATQKPQKLAEAQARIDALTAKGQEMAAQRGVPQEYLTRHRQDVIAAEKAKELIELRQGLHFQPNELPTVNLSKLREKAGFPVTNAGVSDLAKTWENVSDSMLSPGKAGQMVDPERTLPITVDHYLKQDPWLAKIPSEADVYRLTGPSPTASNLGFDHLMDELRNAVNPESGLPKELLFDPAHMGKITVPQAVERVADINAWRAAQKAEADMARANNAATVIHKDYPEKGIRWVELRKPESTGKKIESKLTSKDDDWFDNIEAPDDDLPDDQVNALLNKTVITSEDEAVKTLRDALKYEGDTMKHCVGGYCNDVANGSTRIYSLRDAKGRPHVTVETRPALFGTTHINRLSPAERDAFNAALKEKRPSDMGKLYSEMFPDSSWAQGERSIKQIKGPSNKKPNDEYLPFVQDFVRSGKWNDVSDIQNTGLRRATDAWNTNEEKMIRAAGIDFPTYATQQEIDAINQQVWPGVMGPTKPPGYAEGGSVTAPTWQDAFNEFDKAHRAEFDIGIDRPWAKDEDSVAAKQRIDQRYIDSLKAYDPTLTPDQSVLGANAQPNAYQPKPEGGGWLSQQLSNIGNIFRPVVNSVDDFGKDVRAGAGGVVNEAAQLASESTGGIVSPDAAKVIAAIAYAVATGDPKTAAELGATEAEVAAAIEGASTGASFAWTDAIANSLSPELLSASPYISGFGSATLGDAAFAGATGGGSQIGYNLANVGQTVDEINNAARLSNFLGGQTQNLVGNTASSVAGPFGPAVNIGRSISSGVPMGKAITGAVGSAALGKAVQGVSKATGIPSVVVGSGANYGMTGNAPQASDMAKAAISLYSADKAKQRPIRRA